MIMPFTHDSLDLLLYLPFPFPPSSLSYITSNKETSATEEELGGGHGDGVSKPKMPPTARNQRAAPGASPVPASRPLVESTSARASDSKKRQKKLSECGLQKKK